MVISDQRVSKKSNYIKKDLIIYIRSKKSYKRNPSLESTMLSIFVFKINW